LPEQSTAGTTSTTITATSAATAVLGGGGGVGAQIILNSRPEDPPLHSKQKNIILNWEKRKCCEIKTNLKNLGIERVDPIEYTQKYGTSLVTSVDLPEIALQAKNEHGIQLAADFGTKYFNSLEGDVHALGMVDLDKEGLSEYKYLVDESLKQQQQQLEIK
jgi:hypothetical protein